MEKSLRKVTALAGGNPQVNAVCATAPYSTDAASQRNRIFEWLQSAPLTTLQARQELDVFHPAARVQELRARGHNIVTHWETINSGKAKHRVACYVLLVDNDVN